MDKIFRKAKERFLMSVYGTFYKLKSVDAIVDGTASGRKFVDTYIYNSVECLA